jgi:hypothetical protein
MKEDVTVMGVREDLGGLFDELSSSDNVNEEPDSRCVMLGKEFVDSFGILNVKAGGFDKGLVFHFFNDCEVVSGGGGLWGG